MSIAMAAYPERYHSLCNIIDELPSPPGDAENRFQLGVASGSDTRSYKLDHFLAAAKSRKGKEVDRYSKVSVINTNARLKDSAQADQLRLSKRDFENLGQIGDGQFGSVSAVRCKLDGQVYAMKSIKKFTAIRAGAQMNLPLERYIHTLAHDGGSVPEMIAAFQTDSTLHMITTYAAHGSLWDRMCGLDVGGETSQAGRMAEDEVRWWGCQMVAAIEWLHDQGYVHRDIKPHNFLIHSPSRLTLTDFGSAVALSQPPPHADDPRPYIKKQHCLMPIGTPDYIAPEILKMAEDAMIDDFDSSSDDDPDKTVRPGDLEPKGYGADVDWWSFGATIYEMVTGQAPFYARTVRETYDLIIRCGEGAYQPATAGMSSDMRSIVLSLLASSDIRLGRDSSQDVSTHPFFAGVQSDGPPSSVLSLPLIEIGGGVDQTDTYEATFDHHFQSSVGMTTTLTSSISSNQTTQTEHYTPDRWCGWTWIPPPQTFGQPATTPELATSIRPMRPLPRQGVPVTPARSTIAIVMPMTTPRSTVRSRPISDKRAMAELVKCVQHSARKRASSVKPRFPLGLGGVSKDAVTPTPKARPPLVERSSQQNGPGGVEALAARQARLEDGLIGLEQRFVRLKTRLQSS